MLSGDSSEGRIDEVIAKAIAPHDDTEQLRFDVGGPSVSLSADASLALSLIIHELSTNAAKYGALRHDDGRVEIRWRVTDDRMELTWQEFDGPPVRPPEREGFGSGLIKRAFSNQYEPDISFVFEEDGLKFSLVFKLA